MDEKDEDDEEEMMKEYNSMNAMKKPMNAMKMKEKQISIYKIRFFTRRCSSNV